MNQPPPATTGSARRNRPMIWVPIGVLAAALIGYAVHNAWPLLYPEVLFRAPLDPDCNVRDGPCSLRFASGGEVTFSVRPRGIPVLEPLDLDVILKHLDPLGVEVDFSGLDMNMGYNRVSLEPSSPGRYAGQGMLPVCVRNRMAWEAKVMLKTPRGYLVAPFRFDTYRQSDR